MRAPEISIIVPVYQAEKWMRRCLDSIVAQSFADWECILVDDGSTDDSGAVCDEYASRDSRFKVIHKENGGVSSARQVGLDIARGTYVIHADPDDYPHTDWLKSLHDKAIEENADMTVCDIIFLYKEETFKRQGCIKCDNREDVLEDLISERTWGSCCNRLVRKDCFDRFNISFPIGMALMEDCYVCCMLLINDIKVAYLPVVLYYYDNCENENSLTKKKNLQSLNSIKFFIDSIYPLTTDKRYDEGWYFRKSRFKEILFSYKSCPYNVQKTYPEINERYLNELKDAKFMSQRYGIALCLKGHHTIGHFVFHLAIWIKERINCFRKLMNILLKNVGNEDSDCT